MSAAGGGRRGRRGDGETQGAGRGRELARRVAPGSARLAGAPPAVVRGAAFLENRARRVRRARERHLPVAWAELLGVRAVVGAAVDAWLAAPGTDPADVARYVGHAIGPALASARRRAPELVAAAGGGRPVGEVLVLGPTGAGKSTLVNALVGREVASTGAGAPVTRGVSRHPAGELATLVDTEGLEVGRVARRASELQVLAGLADVVWYCVQAEQGRFEDAEADLVTSTLTTPVLIVLTRTLEQDPSFRDHLARRIALPVVAVHARERRLGATTIPAGGLVELVAASNRLVAGQAGGMQ